MSQSDGTGAYSMVDLSRKLKEAQSPGPSGATPGGHAPSGGGGIAEFYLGRLASLGLGDQLVVHDILHGGARTSLEEAFGAVCEALHERPGATHWIVCDDSWAADLAKSHFHNLLQEATEPDAAISVNVLVLATGGSGGGGTPKKDIGLYAMTYGQTYVASVSQQLNNTALVRALREAGEWRGPSIVLAPQPRDKVAAIAGPDAAVHFVWHPDRAPGRRLEVDEANVAAVVDPEFLKGEHNLSMILAQHTEEHSSLEAKLGSSMQKELTELHRVDEAKVVTVLFGSEAPTKNGAAVAGDIAAMLKQKGLHVDGGSPQPLDRLPQLERLKLSDGIPKKIIVVISTAGVGDFPQGSSGFGKEFLGDRVTPEYEDQGVAVARVELDLSNVEFAVFGLGDTDYHPAEKHKLDSHGTPWTFCTPAKVAATAFAHLGAKELMPGALGFGDDSAKGGWNSGYDEWSEKLWPALAKSGGGGGGGGVGGAKKAGAPKLDPGELVKLSSGALKQPLLSDLLDPARPYSVQPASTGVSKHHGIYQQKLRDWQQITEAEQENPFSFMVRARLPGGRLTCTQLTAVLKIANELCNGTIKITTRQTYQFHGIIKTNLMEAINRINKACMDTIAACGDVNRNVMCGVVKYPTLDPNDSGLKRYERTHEACFKAANDISIQLLPEGLCNTYHEIWVRRGRPNMLDHEYVKQNKVYVKGNALRNRHEAEPMFDKEPVAGRMYLPRKFKIAVVIPPYNDADCFAHDVGFIAVSDRDGQLLGFNISVGGGLGATRHGLTKAFPRLGDVIGFCELADVSMVSQKIMEIQRDFGCRTDRTHARFKYTVEDRGTEFIIAEIDRRMSEDADAQADREGSFKLGTVRPWTLTDNRDTFGESRNSDGTHNFSLYLQNGRIKDYDEHSNYGGHKLDGVKLKQCFAELAAFGERCSEEAPFHFTMSNNQNMSVDRILPRHRDAVHEILTRHNVPVEDSTDTTSYSLMSKHQMACVALPTCGLAMAPSETYLPQLVLKMEAVMGELGFRYALLM